MKNTPALQPETFYHIYNRGVNKMAIFALNDNYLYFLKKYDKYISPIAETYAYCLLGNHFHFLIRTKSEEEILLKNRVNTNRPQNPISVERYMSLQFSHLFNGYTQAFNKQQGRTGKLFELPFRRIEVTNDAYLSQLIYYIHTNPQKHNLIDDFREWPYSSYHSLLSEQPTKLSRKEVITWFGKPKDYQDFHNSFQNTAGISSILLE